ncbi:5254_t:CDS:2, partial [Dentiscutata heterogama]
MSTPTRVTTQLSSSKHKHVEELLPEFQKSDSSESDDFENKYLNSNDNNGSENDNNSISSKTDEKHSNRS